MHPILTVSQFHLPNSVIAGIQEQLAGFGDLPVLVLRKQSALGGVVMDIVSFTQLRASHLFYRPDDTPNYYLFSKWSCCS